MKKKNFEKERFLYLNGFIPHPMNYHTSCVFTVVFTVVFTACSLCVHCVFTANEFWAPSSSSVCRGRRPSSSFVGRSVDPFVGRRPSLVVRRPRCRRSFGTFDVPLSESSARGKFTLDIFCHVSHELLTCACPVYLRIARPIAFVAHRHATLETRGATSPHGPPQEPP